MVTKGDILVWPLFLLLPLMSHPLESTVPPLGFDWRHSLLFCNDKALEILTIKQDPETRLTSGLNIGRLAQTIDIPACTAVHTSVAE